MHLGSPTNFSTEVACKVVKSVGFKTSFLGFEDLQLPAPSVPGQVTCMCFHFLIYEVRVKIRPAFIEFLY